MNFFDGILAAQPFLNNQQSLQNGAIDLGFRNLDVANEFEFLGRFGEGGFSNVLQSNNPYVSQRGLSNILSNQAAQNNIAAQQASLQLSQAIAQQLGLGQQQQQANPLTGLAFANRLNRTDPLSILPGLSGISTRGDVSGNTVNDTRFSGVDKVDSLGFGSYFNIGGNN